MNLPRGDGFQPSHLFCLLVNHAKKAFLFSKHLCHRLDLGKSATHVFYLATAELLILFLVQSCRAISLPVSLPSIVSPRSPLFPLSKAPLGPFLDNGIFQETDEKRRMTAEGRRELQEKLLVEVRGNLSKPASLTIHSYTLDSSVASGVFISSSPSLVSDLASH